MSDHPVAAPARELSPQEHQERVEACRALDQQVKASLAAGREAMWRLAQALAEFDESSGWSALGFERKEDWLAQPDVDLSYDQFQRLVRTYRETALRRVDFATLQTLEPSKVDLVLPAVKDGRVPMTQALEDAGTLTARQLRAAYSRPKPKALSATTVTEAEPVVDFVAQQTLEPSKVRPFGDSPFAPKSKSSHAPERTPTPTPSPTPAMASHEPTTAGSAVHGWPTTLQEARAMGDAALRGNGNATEALRHLLRLLDAEERATEVSR